MVWKLRLIIPYNEWKPLLRTLKMENPINGLIGNTYYLSEDGNTLFNYALWESEEQYDDFLKHTNPETVTLWLEIENLKELKKGMGKIIRCHKFIKIY